MRIRQGFALLGTMMVVAACSGSEGGVGDYTSAPLDTDDQKASYGIGLNMGGQISETKDRLDRAAFFRGVEDGLFRNDPSVDGEELQRVLEAFAAEMQELAAAEAEREAAEASEAGAAYLAENAAREGVVTTESGLQYEVLRQGDGAMPGLEDDVRLHYRGTLVDGEQFDSSYDRGEPAQFNVSQVVPGFTESLMLMAVGSHFRVVLPYDLAYGPQGTGRGIGPNSTLVFEIELLEIVGGG